MLVIVLTQFAITYFCCKLASLIGFGIEKKPNNVSFDFQSIFLATYRPYWVAKVEDWRIKSLWSWSKRES